MFDDSGDSALVRAQRIHFTAMNLSTLLSVAVLLLSPAMLAAVPAYAQDAVMPVENVRIDYAQVLRVDPVFQVLSATRMEQQCGGRPVPVKPSVKGLSRIVGKVKDVLGSGDTEASTVSGNAQDCRMVPIAREFRRPIAFDVDFMYKGMKYRSRLPFDPGNRVRVRISVMPYMAPASR